MASETQVRPRPHSYGEAWPPDDTEESILGTDWHQMTIMNLRMGFNEVARLNQPPGQPVPWQALSQIALLGCERADGTAYRTMPDIFVYRRPIDQSRGSVALALDGPPALIVEILSESTYAFDTDLTRGKGYTYARAGVHEYMAIDPGGLFLPTRVQAWRLVDVEGLYSPWEPDRQGRWQSAEIGVAIGLEGAMATVYTREGQRQLREGEIGVELARKDAELAALRRRLDEPREQHQ